MRAGRDVVFSDGIRTPFGKAGPGKPPLDWIPALDSIYHDGLFIVDVSLPVWIALFWKLFHCVELAALVRHVPEAEFARPRSSGSLASNP